MKYQLEKRLLQVAFALGCAVPLGGGLLGVLFGAGMFDHGGDVTLNSHVRYLSGVLIGVGIGFASAIRNIDQQGSMITILSAIVVVGGLARLFGVLIEGLPAPSMIFALGMELGVVPLLWAWQRHLEARSRAESRASLPA